MSEEREILNSQGTPRWIGLAVFVLAAISLVSLGIGWSAATRTKAAEQTLATQTQTLKQSQDLLGQRLTQAEDSKTEMRGELSTVNDRLKLTQGELAHSRKTVKDLRQEQTQKLSEMQTNVNSQLATKASTEDLNKLGGDVNGVKTDLEATKQSLQMTKGEFGTLIARNHDDIEQLRRLGQRDYYEFTIDRRGSRQKVGDLMVELRGTNQKRNLFSLALYVDDMRLEKKNRSVNEPIYFYTRGSRSALELVINQVGKNKVVGYLSVPKVNPPAQSSGN